MESSSRFISSSFLAMSKRNPQIFNAFAQSFQFPGQFGVHCIHPFFSLKTVDLKVVTVPEERLAQVRKRNTAQLR
ncbi:hypothetical protein A6M21_00870 [Desulfotomaculum copahuensis]|uniref:Uncharacterized protein n=1 Tax=Desulfotomaculum copahuensis TaxID=1838280 RepID=A0A1B7LBZ4_9FIRM|nr:hypothetical protein A6M21_00870 [Desulfotomaculum copahuensis]